MDSMDTNFYHRSMSHLSSPWTCFSSYSFMLQHITLSNLACSHIIRSWGPESTHTARYVSRVEAIMRIWWGSNGGSNGGDGKKLRHGRRSRWVVAFCSCYCFFGAGLPSPRFSVSSLLKNEQSHLVSTTTQLTRHPILKFLPSLYNNKNGLPASDPTFPYHQHHSSVSPASMSLTSNQVSESRSRKKSSSFPTLSTLIHRNT